MNSDKSLSESISQTVHNLKMIHKYKKTSKFFDKLNKMKDDINKLKTDETVSFIDLDKLLLKAKFDFEKNYIPVITEETTYNLILYSYIQDILVTYKDSIVHNSIYSDRCNYDMIQHVILVATDKIMKNGKRMYKKIFDNNGLDNYNQTVLMLSTLCRYEVYKFMKN